MDEGPWTSEVLIGDVPLRVRRTLTFVYDRSEFATWL
jgi:hypothetical protein